MSFFVHSFLIQQENNTQTLWLVSDIQKLLYDWWKIDTLIRQSDWRKIHTLTRQSDWCESHTLMRRSDWGEQHITLYANLELFFILEKKKD